MWAAKPPVDKRLSVLEALRDATRSRHAQLEASPAMMRLFDANYSMSEYREHLGRLLGLWEPLEQAVADVAGPENPVLKLQRSGDLIDDLRAMGATTRDIDTLDRYRGFTQIEAGGLRGYSYVMLGSMMGGRVIVKRLRAVLGPDVKVRFYGAGNGGFGALWAAFCADLQKKEGNDVQKICATAVAIFEAYAAWFSEPCAGERR